MRARREKPDRAATRQEDAATGLFAPDNATHFYAWVFAATVIGSIAMPLWYAWTRSP